ncbi:MAG: DUF2520 domain-containing protein [Oscillospiraceae bacterium]|nr:DUF2520 domain-containing protein [Oscillospiraceae bacterium]
MRIGFAGAGRVGTSLGKYLSCNNIEISGYYNRTAEAAKESAEFVSCSVFDSPAQLAELSDIIFITVCDSAISSIWDSIEVSGAALCGKIFCHCSGALSSQVLSGCHKYGAYACSLHMMQAVSDRFTSFVRMKNAVFTSEGDKETLDVITSMLSSCGNKLYKIDTDKKVLYHTAASVVSNLIDGLVHTGLSLMTQCGFDENEARLLMSPLIRDNIENILSKGTAAALTGPLERNDIQTVSKHICCLGHEDAAMYKAVSLEVLKAARLKNPHHDYREMEALLRK